MDATRDGTQGVASAAPRTPVTTGPRRGRWLTLAGLTAGFLVLWIGAAAFGILSPTAKVYDIRTCLPDEFDETSRLCTVDRNAFPETTTLLYVSFADRQVEYGQRFERRWYRNGRVFLEKESFFDDAWEGWTWVREEGGFAPGEYHLRVIVEGRAYTHRFAVGELTGRETTTLPGA